MIASVAKSGLLLPASKTLNNNEHRTPLVSLTALMTEKPQSWSLFTRKMLSYLLSVTYGVTRPQWVIQTICFLVITIIAHENRSRRHHKQHFLSTLVCKNGCLKKTYLDQWLGSCFLASRSRYPLTRWCGCGMSNLRGSVYWGHIRTSSDTLCVGYRWWWVLPAVRREWMECLNYVNT